MALLSQPLPCTNGVLSIAIAFLSLSFPGVRLAIPRVDRATGNQSEVTEVRFLLLETTKIIGVHMSSEVSNGEVSKGSLFRPFAVAVSVLLFLAAISSAFAQQPFLMSRGDMVRSGANTSETLLTPSNVTNGSFARLFSVPVDYQILAQPLYVPNVNIAGQGVHNVVYVVTQMDSVYAVDADNGAQLWYASMLGGGVPASGSNLPCGKLGGFTKEGIIGTPVIDLSTNTMYLVAKTVLSGTVYHFLHALDITSGNEQVSMGSPVQITATSLSKKGTRMYFNSLHQKNRPGLLLQNGVLYMGFGSNGCNDHNTGWVLSYDATNLQQLGAFNTSPDIGFASVWQTGNGISADAEGNIYVATAESTTYDVQNGGQTYANSILKLTQSFSPTPELNLSDYFSPWNVTYLDSHDLDVSSVGPIVLPDQNGPPTCSQNPCHEVIASGKQGVVYVLDRDNMGQFSQTGQDNILQEFSLINAGELMASPAYWNGTVYFSPGGSPIQAFQVSNGVLSPSAQTTQRFVGACAPAISSNGTANGVLWVLTGKLIALDAVSLKQLYTSAKLPPLTHFDTPTVANGRVYVGGQSSLEVFGLLQILNITGGNNQTAQVLSPLPAPLTVVAENPYSGQPDPGVTVTFSDGGKGGTFNPPSAVTDSNGVVSTVYTFPKKAGTYTLTISAPNFGSITATEIATPAPATTLITYSGAKQTGDAGSVLPNPLVTEALDAYRNPVPGVPVTFTANKNGIPNPTSATTDARGLASTSLQLPQTVGTVTVTASSSGLHSALFAEYSVAGQVASVMVTGGNNQVAPAGTMLPQNLAVVVGDQYGNPVQGVAITFSDGGVGGIFSNPNPGTSDSAGGVNQIYTLPPTPGTVTISANAAGVANPAVFTETGQ